MKSLLIYIIYCFNLIVCFGQILRHFDSRVCDQDYFFKNVLKPEIKSKALVVNKIIDLVLNSNERNKTYEELAEFVDTFGGRLTGSEALENSTDFLMKNLKNENIDSVYTEEVLVPKWERGSEWARVVEPREQQLNILAMVGSIATPEDGITTELIVFKSLEEVNEISNDLIKDKIVLFDTNVINGSFTKFKLEATRLVAEARGLAVLFKSFAKNMVYLTHAGIIRYYSKDLQIPVASIASEDSELLSRISKRGVKVVINLYLESTFHGITQSRNLIADLKGNQYPNEMVIISAHIDSWDIGQGAIDDGGGIFIAMRAIKLFNKLGLKHKRTLRMVLFTGEEVGRFGSKAYIERHYNMSDHISLILNSDFGTFLPLGLTFSGNNTRSQCIVYQTLRLLSFINSTELVVGKGYDLTQSDANEFINEGVPAAGLLTDNLKHLFYSHTNADTISAVDPYFLDLCTIVWTATSFVFSDLSIKLPKDN